MINLIPNEEKKKITTDFHYRVITLFFLVIDFSILVACIAISPTYVYSIMKDSAATRKLQIQKASPIPPEAEQSLNESININNKLNLINGAEANKFLVSERVINTILAKKDSSIKITRILYTENDPILGEGVTIGGIASSREDLLAFRQVLEEDTSDFKNVNLPISDFVKITNIPFSLTLVPIHNNTTNPS